MITVYYIGGPWDLVKRALPAEPKPRITIREAVGEPFRVEDIADGIFRNPNVEMIQFVDHRYFVRPVGRDVYVAIHEDVAS
jgi:hypothetical protein